MTKVKAAGIFLVNKENKILAGHPTRHPDDIWSIPKGKIEEDENSFEGALRETFEETNIELRTHENLFYHELKIKNYRHGKKSLMPFVVLESENELDFNKFEIKCNSKVPEEKGGFPEFDSYKWMTFNEAEKLLHYTQAQSLEEIKKLINK